MRHKDQVLIDCYFISTIQQETIKFIYKVAVSAQYGTPANLNVQSIDTNDKLAMAWSNNDFAVYVNGTQAYSSTSGSAPTGMDTIFKSMNGMATMLDKCQTMKALYFARQD